MALNDREALRIYRDPMLPPQEKRRLMMELEAGAPQLTDLRVAGTGGGGETGWAAGNPEIMAGNAAIEDDQARQEAAAEAARREQDKPPEPPGNWLMGKETPPAPAAPAPEAPPEPELDAPGPAQSPGPDTGMYRSSLNRGVLALGQGGPAGPQVPQERVREEMQFQVGTMSPEQGRELGIAEQQRDEATLAKERAAASIAMQAEETRVAAEAAALEERKQLAELNARKIQRAQQLRERQNQISEEIASADIKQPSLWSRDNFGENILTALSVALFAIGSRNGSGAEHVKSLANREVDRQARWLKAKQGQVDALGTMIERHYANFGDVEAAKKQSVVDILGKAELEVRRQALDAEKQGAGTVIPRLQELEGQLRVAREKAEVERNQLLDRVISTSAAREMVRDRTQALQAPMQQPGAAPTAKTAPVDRRTGEELDAAARARPRGAAGQPAAKAGNPDLQRAFELQRSGKSDEAIAALPPGAKAALRALYKARKADMGAGTTDADALDQAFKDLGMSGPESAQLVPQAARERMVTLGTGERLYAPTKEQAKDIGGKIAKLDGTVGGLSKMLALSRQYKGSGAIPPAVKSEIEQLGNALMFELSLAQEQGTVREAELPLYEKMVGSAIANYFKDPRYDLEAGLREVRRVFAFTRNRLISNLSPSPTGEGGPQRAREVGR